jgi:hypothetical protein
VLASHGGYKFYKVALSGYATGENIARACEAAGLLTPCPCFSGEWFGYNQGTGGMSCVVTSEIGCKSPMSTSSQVACGTSPALCAAFDGVFIYMGWWEHGDGCGAVSGSWCVKGRSHAGYYAMCAAKI